MPRRRLIITSTSPIILPSPAEPVDPAARAGPATAASDI